MSRQSTLNSDWTTIILTRISRIPKMESNLNRIHVCPRIIFEFREFCYVEFYRQPTRAGGAQGAERFVDRQAVCASSACVCRPSYASLTHSLLPGCTTYLRSKTISVPNSQACLTQTNSESEGRILLQYFFTAMIL